MKRLSEEEEVIGMSAAENPVFLLFLFRVCSKFLGFWVTLGEKQTLVTFSLKLNIV